MVYHFRWFHGLSFHMVSSEIRDKEVKHVVVFYTEVYLALTADKDTMKSI